MLVQQFNGPRSPEMLAAADRVAVNGWARSCWRIRRCAKNWWPW